MFPAGKGWDLEVNEFDSRDNGGVIYDENGVKVIHWQRSHAKDGASGYRLDWNDMCFVWTGDGRPSPHRRRICQRLRSLCDRNTNLTCRHQFCVQGIPPFLGRYTIDTHHTPAYAASYVANLIQPRLFMTTHMAFTPYQNEEAVAEIRVHWKGPYVREQEIDPELYYREGYHLLLLTEWPVEGDLVVPLDQAPTEMTDSISAEWRLKKKNLEARGENQRRPQLKIIPRGQSFGLLFLWRIF